MQLFDIGAVRFDGDYTLKSGVISPYYLDLRVLVSKPQLLQQVSNAMHQLLEENGARYDIVCGVPYTALPIATALSLKHSVPMIMKRKEVVFAISLICMHCSITTIAFVLGQEVWNQEAD